MNQAERRQFLIRALLDEHPRYRSIEIPADGKGQRDLLRALMNVREPAPISDEYRAVERAYLREVTAEKGVVSLCDLSPVDEDLYLWQGDITRLAVDAIVNAANSALLGCFQPLHYCIDNAIHTYAGLDLRNCCNEIMQAQGHPEPAGQAKITPGFNLPCNYVLHTVGPIVNGRLTEEHCQTLASCYRACLELAEENECKSMAFCCISTGVFGFPQEEAARIAVRTVKDFLQTHKNMQVLFNVFKDRDLELYRDLLL